MPASGRCVRAEQKRIVLLLLWLLLLRRRRLTAAEREENPQGRARPPEVRMLDGGSNARPPAHVYSNWISCMHLSTGPFMLMGPM